MCKQLGVIGFANVAGRAQESPKASDGVSSSTKNINAQISGHRPAGALWGELSPEWQKADEGRAMTIDSCQQRPTSNVRTDCRFTELHSEWT